MGRGERPVYCPHLVGHSSVRPIKLRFDGWWPGSTHQTCISWPRPDPVDHFFSDYGPRSVLPHILFKRTGPARPCPPRFRTISARPGPCRLSNRPGLHHRPKTKAHENSTQGGSGTAILTGGLLQRKAATTGRWREQPWAPWETRFCREHYKQT